MDNTGDGNGQDGGPDSTRLSHMQRITSADGSQYYDIEVLDAFSARDQNGYEWVLSMPNADPNSEDGNGSGPSVYNTTTGEGDEDSTRRVHDEKISGNLTDTNPAQFILVQRNDAISFRKVNGEEVVLVMPSNNDPNSGDPAASTYTTPQNYDPSDTDPDDAPPANDDPNVYFAFVQGSGGINTGNDDGCEVAMGPLWWLRSASGSSIIFVQVTYGGSAISGPLTPPTINFITANSPTPEGQDVFGAAGVTQTISGATPAPIVNPVSDAMLSAYYQWTVAPPVLGTPDETTPAELIYYLKTTVYSQNAAAFHWTPLTLPDLTASNYMSTGYGVSGGEGTVPLITLTGGGANFNVAPLSTLQSLLPSWSITDINRAINLNALGNIFTSVTDVDFYISALNAIYAAIGAPINFTGPFSLDINPASGIYNAQGTAVFEIDLGKLSPQPHAADGDPLQFSFSIHATSPGGTSHMNVDISAQAFMTLRNFPIDAQNNPTPAFTLWLNATTPKSCGKPGQGGIESVNGVTQDVVLTAYIDPKSSDIQFGPPAPTPGVPF